MKLIILFLGVMSLVYEGECQLTWTAPTGVPSGGGDAGIVAAIDQENDVANSVLTVTMGANPTGVTVDSQTPASIFDATLTTNGLNAELVLAANQVVDYSAHTSHVVQIKVVGATTETATITLAVRPIRYAMPLQCVDVQNEYYAANAVLATSLATGAQTVTQAQVGTTSGYTFDTTNGQIKTDAIITTAITATQVTVVTTGVEAFGTTTTATSTVYLCINGGCTCSSVLSGVSTITAGLLSFIMFLMLKLK